MTTRRRRLPGPPPPRGRSGRFGLPPLAMRLLSVKTCECGIDLDALPEDSREPVPHGRALEAHEAPAGVDAAARHIAAGHERAVTGAEAHQLALRGAPAAARARPHGRASPRPAPPRARPGSRPAPRAEAPCRRAVRRPARPGRPRPVPP